jgi:uncharacterized protein (TIGR03437 family)
MYSRKPTHFFSLITVAVAGLMLPVPATAAFTISSVTNFASRVPTGVPSYGIAQGAAFAVIGTGVGQDPPTQATFPLPTSAGLNGVSINIAVGSSSVAAIMLYVSANEIDAILPSNTPVGTGTITVSNGSDSAKAPITVVTAAFGIATVVPVGLGPAIAFTTADDGTTTLINSVNPALPGQTVTIAGMGLGAIAGDETQSGISGAPAANVTVWVGSQQVPVASAGRGACCTGLDPAYPIPAGVAAWDLISFVVPDGISGCGVSIAVQIGNMISNVPSIAIAGSNGQCYDLSGINFDLTTVNNPMKTGLESFTRVVAKDYEATGTSVVTSDIGAASFQAVNVDTTALNLPTNLLAFSAAFTTGNCTVQVARFDRANLPPTPTPVPNPHPPVILDVGAAINVTGPVAAKPLAKGKDGSYSASLANIISIPLPGLPPIANGGPLFLQPGGYVMDNGAGGADVGPFSVNFTGPPLLNWDNIDQVSLISRAQGVDIKWSGTDPSTIVGIGGSATLIQGTVIITGSFQCTEKASAGHFTIPPFVTLSMPQIPVALNPLSSIGNITVSDLVYQYLPIPGLDFNVYNWISGTGRNVGFQ